MAANVIKGYTIVAVFSKRNGPTPTPFLFIFGLFKQTIQLLKHINVKKYLVHPVYENGIQT